MEPIGGQCSTLSSSSNFSSSGQKCERDLAFKIEDVRPWGAQQKFSAAFADVSISWRGFTGIMSTKLGNVSVSLPCSDHWLTQIVAGMRANCSQ